MMVLGTLFSVLIGLSLGLLGGGGSILTVPILRYTFHLPAHEAIASSLFVVGTTSLFGLFQHARLGNVRFRAGLLFSVGGMIGAFFGGKLGSQLPGALLLLLFAAMMLATAYAMMRKRKTRENPTVLDGESQKPAGQSREPGEMPPSHHTTSTRGVFLMLFEGFVVGGFTGMVGAGGGFLVVPALVLLAKMPIKHAVGTSLMVISLKSFAGFAGYAGEVHVNWTLTALVSGAAMVGTVFGALLAKRVSANHLRTGFAWFVVVMAIFILWQEVPALFVETAGE